MEIRKIKSSIKQIDKIYHVSDIHIRTLKRHKEYKTVFKNLFEYINTNATEKTKRQATAKKQASQANIAQDKPG